MTDPLSLRAHATRRLAALAATGVIGALSPLAGAAPAHAATAAPCPARFGATAASELVALRQLDLAPLGLATPPLAELHAGVTHAGMAGGPPHSAAEARLLSGRVAGLPVSARSKAYQEAPPPHDRPAISRTAALDVGGVHLGAGTLSAQATLRDGGRCAPGAGPVGDSTATVADARILSLLGFETLTAHAFTEVASDGDRPAASATASGDLTRFQLFAGTREALTVRVISPARLRVVAGARKTVSYTAPVLEVTVPGRPPLRLSDPSGHLDIAIPVDAGSTSLAGSLARAEGIPVVSGLPLGALVPRSAPLPATGPVEDDGRAADLLRDLPGVPELTGIVDDVTNAPSLQRATGGRVVVLRLALGELSKETSATGVHAKATAVRIKLLVRSKWAGHNDGYGGTDQTPVLDLGVCVLEAAAATPLPPYGGTGAGTGGATTTPAASLPVTGDRVALVLGAGTVLLVAGRLLLVLARRRFEGGSPS